MLDLFTLDKSIIRPYVEEDFEQLAQVYKSAFAEPPWNETWKTEEIESDVNFAKTQYEPIILVAETNKKIIGFTWGYKLPIDKFDFLKGKIKENTSYIDEIAVEAASRIRGTGTALGIEYQNACKEKKY